MYTGHSDDDTISETNLYIFDYIFNIFAIQCGLRLSMICGFKILHDYSKECLNKVFPFQTFYDDVYILQIIDTVVNFMG